MCKISWNACGNCVLQFGFHLSILIKFGWCLYLKAFQYCTLTCLSLFNVIKQLFVLLFDADTLNDIIVTWNTVNDTQESVVEYGDGGLTLTAKATCTLFVSGGKEKRKQYIHRVKLSNLTPGRKYSKSTQFFFTVNFSSPLYLMLQYLKKL
jgi:hypothetical protein